VARSGVINRRNQYGLGIVTGQLWSLGTTIVQARLRAQMNTALYAKTLVRKDVASSSSSRPASVAGEAQKDDDEYDFSSKVCLIAPSSEFRLSTIETGTDHNPHDNRCRPH
jgi:hypothetical protein